MPLIICQKTDFSSRARTWALCLATTLWVFVVQPVPLARAISIEHAEPDSIGPLARAISIEHAEPDSIGPLALATTEPAYSSVSESPYQNRSESSLPAASAAGAPIVDVSVMQDDASARIAGATLRRPGSFVKEAVIEPVLGLVSHRLWVSAPVGTPDSDRAAIQRMPGQFRGVGFPDIRSHRKIERYNSYDPEQPFNWNSMVAWRMADDGEQAREPIADVHCMGLSPQAVARRADRYEHLIQEIADQYETSANLVKAIVAKESCFDSEALSRAGALGLMQLMPETARWLKVKDPLDPEENLRAGVRYIARLRKQFDSLELALAAYNAGPGNVRRYKGVPPFAETESYVLMVKAYYRRYVAANTLATR